MQSQFEVQLSKSKFVAGVQCLKRLYLQVYEPGLAAEPDEATAAILNQGTEIGALARRAFSCGVTIEAGRDEIESALKRTQQLIGDVRIRAIFEAAFRHKGVAVRVDILERLPRNRWRLIEVKSTTGIKDYHLYDVAIQRHVLRGCGINVTAACLMHVNRNYVYGGQEYRLRHLFEIEDLTKEVDKMDGDVPMLLRRQRRVLKDDSPPEIEPGPQCQVPVECEFYDHCHDPLPAGHVSELPRIGDAKVATLLDQGITLISEIPEDFPLGALATRAWEAARRGRLWLSDDLSQELRKLKYPLTFMDFETLNPALPRYAGMRPYDHIPFQWSVHRQTSQKTRLEHFEFLATDNADPSRQFMESLCWALKGKGHVVVYNRSFESSRLNELASWFPEYAEQIERIQGRLWDLLPIVRRNVYHPDFRGSYSIKDVLPVLVPGMTYEGMEIANGEQAGLVWDHLVRGEVGKGEKERVRKALLAYCAQDTLGMTKLLAYLQRAVRSKSTSRR
jgi:predicted RecB family nuclease